MNQPTVYELVCGAVSEICLSVFHYDPNDVLKFPYPGNMIAPLVRLVDDPAATEKDLREEIELMESLGYLDARDMLLVNRIVAEHFGYMGEAYENSFLEILYRLSGESDYGDAQGWMEDLADLDKSTLTKEKVLEIIRVRREVRNEKIADYAMGLFNWKFLAEDAKENFLEYKKDMDEYDEPNGTAYLGTVFSLCPSGKYYLPFANSNLSPCPVCEGTTKVLDEDCPYCVGEGGVYGTSEAVDDEAFYVGLNAAAEDVGGWIENGEGDPCDLFFCMSFEELMWDEEEDEEDTEDTRVPYSGTLVD